MRWSIKHRPKHLSECVLDHIDEESQNLLRRAVTAGSLPNLLLHGPPGTGKTTIARILCDHKRFEVHSFNGSILEKRHLPTLEDIVSTCSLCLKPKCIMIDEIDGLTMGAQKALRALMELELTSDVSWIWTANDLGSIMPALQSRVSLIDCSFSMDRSDATPAMIEADLAGIFRRCRQVAAAEGFQDLSHEDVRRVVEVHYPDMRQIVDAVQLKCEANYARLD